MPCVFEYDVLKANATASSREATTTVIRDTQYKLHISHAATGSFGYAEETDQHRYIGPTTENKIFEPIDFIVGNDAESTDYGIANLVGVLGVQSFSSFHTCGVWTHTMWDGVSTIPFYTDYAINTYYTNSSSTFTSNENDLYTSLSYRVTYKNVDYYANKWTYAFSSDWYYVNTPFFYASGEGTATVEKFTGNTIYSKWPVVYSSRITRQYGSRYMKSSSTSGGLLYGFISAHPDIETSNIGSETIYATCLSPINKEDTLPSSGFTSTCADSVKKIGTPTSKLLGVFYRPDSLADISSNYKWEIDIDGEDVRTELFVTKYLPSATPWAEETWTPEFVENHFAYLCYLF